MHVDLRRFRSQATTRVVFWTALTLVTFSACNSKPRSPALSNGTPVSQAAANSSASANQFDGGTYCVQTFLERPRPAQSLHFSIQVVESDPSRKSKDFEADYAGDVVDLVHRDRWLATDQDKQFFEDSKKFDDPKIITRTIHDGVAEETVTNHANRTDEVSWRGVITSMAQGGTPWNLFVDRPKVNPVGRENVNGFETIKYAVDTTHETQSEKAARTAFNRLQNYEIAGTAWVQKDANCVLQYNIDYQETSKEGKVRKTHYEGTTAKK
jgi:hypothetical protein